MDRITILQTISKTNPWHKTRKVPKEQLELFKRKEFFGMKDRFSDFNMAELVVGARRVGKSVLMYQLIQHLIDKKINPKRILFIQGDNPILREIDTDNTILSEILMLYQDFILDEKFESLSEEVFIFIDEAHNLEKWQLEVKTLIDLKLKIKFFVTGSSSSELRRGSQSPLVGRVKIEVLPPFTFLDFVRFKLNAYDITNPLSASLIKASSEFRQQMISGDVNGLLDIATNVQPIIQKYKFKDKYNDYLFGGGFPYSLRQKPEDRTRYLRDLLTMTLSKDILTKAGVREPQAFERLIVNLCLMVGSKVRFKPLAEKIGVDERSIVKYVDHYSDSHWINVSSQFHFTQKQPSIKTDKKIYILDNGVVNALNFKNAQEVHTERSYRGHLVENSLYNHLLSWKQSIAGPFQNDIAYWFEESKGWEIDYIVDISGGVIPIECKTKVDTNDSNLEPIEYFMKKRSSTKFGVLTTEEDLLVKKNVFFIPYWLLNLLI